MFEVSLLMQVKGRWPVQAPSRVWMSYCLSAPPCVCLTVRQLCSPISLLPVVCLTLHPLNYSPACLSHFLPPFLIHPAIYLCPFLSLCVPAVGIVEDGRGRGGRVGGFVKRQPGNSPQRLSLKPPLLHLTLCPGSPDKPMNTHIHLHKCTHRHTHR